MTFSNQCKLIAILTTALLTLFACKEKTHKTDKTDTLDSDSTETDSDSTDDSAGTDSDSESANPCEQFHSYAEECNITGNTLTSLDTMCAFMDSLFIDSFLQEMVDCFSQESCDEFIAMLASAGDTEVDAGIDNPFTACAANALVTADPDQANLDFHEHYCAYAMQCDVALSQAECDLYFLDPENLLLFNVVDTPYITDADDCVDPMPACSEDVTTCIDEVEAEVAAALSFLFGN